jgi:aryl-alcohol dehydrogenase-like predicted oxidoreductase
MKMRTLGRTGIRVSPYCPGAAMLGPGGESEWIVGKALKGRHNVMLATRINGLPGEGPNVQETG